MKFFVYAKFDVCGETATTFEGFYRLEDAMECINKIAAERNVAGEKVHALHLIEGAEIKLVEKTKVTVYEAGGHK